MKKAVFASIFLLGLLFSMPTFAEETIDDFTVEIKVNSDASLSVTENITYNFGGEQKHGIYRDIPVKYKARGGNYNLRISDISVTDENDNSYEFALQNSGNNKRIKIGDASQYVTGVKIYRIKYNMRRAVNFFNDYDELYWNVTGNEWPVPIKQTKATINLPASASLPALKWQCFAGPEGSTKKCISDRTLISSQDKANGFTFIHDQLLVGEGMSVAIGLPKGVINKPLMLIIIWETILDNWVIALPFLVFAAMYYLWYKKGRDPQGRETIIAEFDAPDNLTPAEVGAIIDENTQNKDISAEIIYLAVKGYIKIDYKKKEGIFSADDYELEKLKGSDDLENEFEKKLLDSLFADGKKWVKLSDLKNTYYKDLQEVKKAVYKSLTEKKYFLKNPSVVRAIYLTAGIVFGFLGWFIGLSLGYLGVISFIISGVIIIIFSFLMPAKTLAGVLAKEKILGLKLYLSVAEKDRINFHNAPAKKPEVFEKLLPYAMVLGVEKQWAKQFEGIYNENPGWYNGPAGTMFNPVLFAGSLGNFTAKAESAMSTAPSGGSGFSGGGAGGGFGGGGGGSW